MSLLGLKKCLGNFDFVQDSLSLVIFIKRNFEHDMLVYICFETQRYWPHHIYISCLFKNNKPTLFKTVSMSNISVLVEVKSSNKANTLLQCNFISTKANNKGKQEIMLMKSNEYYYNGYYLYIY